MGAGVFRLPCWLRAYMTILCKGKMQGAVQMSLLSQAVPLSLQLTTIALESLGHSPIIIYIIYIVSISRHIIYLN